MFGEHDVSSSSRDASNRYRKCARYMWWSKRPVNENSHDAGWSAAVNTCLKTSLQYYQVLHPDEHIPSAQLGLLSNLVQAVGQDEGHPALLALQTLVSKGPGYEQDVPVTLIRGVAQSKGKIVFDLGRLPETMDLSSTGPNGQESFGPLNPTEMARLWASIVNGSGAVDEKGRLELDHQTWDGCYIVGNTGTARRLALWLRLQNYYGRVGGAATPTRSVKAWVTPYALNPASLDYLQREGRILFAVHNDDLENAVKTIALKESGALYVGPANPPLPNDIVRPAVIVLPLANCVPMGRLEGLLELHRWADRLFDLNRYLCERASTYNYKYR